MASIWNWSVTASDNATSDSLVNWSEGMLPSAVNNSARQVMARVAEFLKDISGITSAGGSATAMTLTSASPFTALTDGIVVSMTAVSSNTSGAATLAVNGLSAKAIKIVQYPSGEADPSAGAIVAGGRYLLSYDSGANSGVGAWMLLNPTSADPETSVSTLRAELGGVDVSAGTASAMTLTTASMVGALADGAFVGFLSGTTSTGAATIDVDSLGAKAIRVFLNGAEAPLYANAIIAGSIYELAYSEAANSAAGAWILKNPSPGDVATPARAYAFFLSSV